MINYKDMNGGELVQACGRDAQKWADAFCQLVPGAPAQDVMFGWFANAMMTMWDVANSEATHDDTALCDHISNLIRNRDLWRELADRPEAA